MFLSAAWCRLSCNCKTEKGKGWSEVITGTSRPADASVSTNGDYNWGFCFEQWEKRFAFYLFYIDLFNFCVMTHLFFWSSLQVAQMRILALLERNSIQEFLLALLQNSLTVMRHFHSNAKSDRYFLRWYIIWWFVENHLVSFPMKHSFSFGLSYTSMTINYPQPMYPFDVLLFFSLFSIDSSNIGSYWCYREVYPTIQLSTSQNQQTWHFVCRYPLFQGMTFAIYTSSSSGYRFHKKWKCKYACTISQSHTIGFSIGWC